MGIFVKVVLFIVVIFTIDKTLEYYRKKKLFELVSWSVIGDYNPYLSEHSYIDALIFEIITAQQDDSIEHKYRIDREDFEIVKEIVEEYQSYIAKLYFRNKLYLFERKYHVTKKDYFMFMFYHFLSKYSTKSDFIGYNMHRELIESKWFEDGESSSFTYSLSDFGILYYKLYYITYMYCKRSAAFKYKVDDWCEHLKEILDERQIKICHYRP